MSAIARSIDGVLELRAERDSLREQLDSCCAARRVLEAERDQLAVAVEELRSEEVIDGAQIALSACTLEDGRTGISFQGIAGLDDETWTGVMSNDEAEAIAHTILELVRRNRSIS